MATDGTEATVLCIYCPYHNENNKRLQHMDLNEKTFAPLSQQERLCLHPEKQRKLTQQPRVDSISKQTFDHSPQRDTDRVRGWPRRIDLKHYKRPCRMHIAQTVQYDQFLEGKKLGVKLRHTET